MLKFCDFIQVYVFTTNHHLKRDLILLILVERIIHCGKSMSVDLFLTLVMPLERFLSNFYPGIRSLVYVHMILVSSHENIMLT